MGCLARLGQTSAAAGAAAAINTSYSVWSGSVALFCCCCRYLYCFELFYCFLWTRAHGLAVQAELVPPLCQRWHRLS